MKVKKALPFSSTRLRNFMRKNYCCLKARMVIRPLRVAEKRELMGERVMASHLRASLLSSAALRLALNIRNTIMANTTAIKGTTIIVRSRETSRIPKYSKKSR